MIHPSILRLFRGSTYLRILPKGRSFLSKVTISSAGVEVMEDLQEWAKKCHRRCSPTREPCSLTSGGRGTSPG